MRSLETMSRPGRAQKIALKPGHSPLDWARLKNSGTDLRFAGLPKSSYPPTEVLGQVTAAELRQHSTPGDCWTVLDRKVYNLTAYMDFHPGGEAELLRAAGRDGTQVFSEVHPWINFEILLDKCVIGRYVGDPREIR